MVQQQMTKSFFSTYIISTQTCTSVWYSQGHGTSLSLHCEVLLNLFIWQKRLETKIKGV